jgi:hypothetical protein
MSTDPAGTPSLSESWSRARNAATTLVQAAHAVRSNHAGAVTLLHQELGDVTRRRVAMVVLGVLPTEYTVEVADLLVHASTSDRDALLVRQIFGRLPRHQVVDVVPPAVWRFVAQGADYVEYRRLAELLDYLALDDALRLLCEVALDSDDSETREVGREYWPDTGRGRRQL